MMYEVEIQKEHQFHTIMVIHVQTCDVGAIVQAYWRAHLADVYHIDCLWNMHHHGQLMGCTGMMCST